MAESCLSSESFCARLLHSASVGLLLLMIAAVVSHNAQRMRHMTGHHSSSNAHSKLVASSQLLIAAELTQEAEPLLRSHVRLQSLASVGLQLLMSFDKLLSV